MEDITGSQRINERIGGDGDGDEDEELMRELKEKEMEEELMRELEEI